MTLNNYWKYFKYISSNNPPTSNATRLSFGCSFPNYYDPTSIDDDSRCNIMADIPANDEQHTWIIHKDLRIFVGSGDTDPTADDFKLVSDITSQFVNYEYKYSIVNEDGALTLIFSVSGINATDTDKTITEVLVAKQVEVRYNTGYDNYRPWIAFVHEMLDEPVVAKANCGFAFDYKWKIG